MPRYFFNVADGRCETDEIGVVLASEREARQEAIRRSAILLRVTRTAEGAEKPTGWTIEVRDEAGEVVFQLAGQQGLGATARAQGERPQPASTV